MKYITIILLLFGCAQNEKPETLKEPEEGSSCTIVGGSKYTYTKDKLVVKENELDHYIENKLGKGNVEVMFGNVPLPSGDFELTTRNDTSFVKDLNTGKTTAFVGEPKAYSDNQKGPK